MIYIRNLLFLKSTYFLFHAIANARARADRIVGQPILSHTCGNISPFCVHSFFLLGLSAKQLHLLSSYFT